MDSSLRKHYIDNLRWLIILILVPYHAAMSWNVWDEPNYIILEGNKVLSSFVVFFSPYFMPILFVLAGISTKYALKKRTNKEYITERTKKLLVPFLFGTIVLMPIMTYLADKFNHSYNGSFIRHYTVFFTKFTDLTGYDGGFSVGHFWFLLYLFVISCLSVVLILLMSKLSRNRTITLPFWIVILLGLPLPVFSELLSVSGKSLVEYTYLFMIGYYVFSNDVIVGKAERYCRILFGIGIAATIFDVYLFIWSSEKYDVLNTAAKYVSEWFMVLALIGLSKKYLNFSGQVAGYMSKRSFLFYIYHFVWVVFIQYLLYMMFGSQTLVLFVGTVILAYPAAFICCEISIRIPVLCFLTGTKHISEML